MLISYYYLYGSIMTDSQNPFNIVLVKAIEGHFLKDFEWHSSRWVGLLRRLEVFLGRLLKGLVPPSQLHAAMTPPMQSSQNSRDGVSACPSLCVSTESGGGERPSRSSAWRVHTQTRTGNRDNQGTGIRPTCTEINQNNWLGLEGSLVML